MLLEEEKAKWEVEVIREGKEVMCEEGLSEARAPAVLGKSSDGGTARAKAVQVGDGSKVRGRKWVQALTEMGSSRGLWNTGPG